MSYQRKRRKPKAEINVVPYIDVMLVLLVIFMVTAPLITQGVKVNLPKQDANPLLEDAKPPVIATIESDGTYWFTDDKGKSEELPLDDLVARIAAIVELAPSTHVVVKGDEKVPYGYVVSLMADLENAGIETVGLMTDPSGG
ncbi:protein TolR [Corallincola platygyrae]|uniref:Tol-Pal system protein TolR n=1 Tax=Corallincola platygyrae TaxID=1193278 RepID=A0ABW4XTF8_9GAMM